MSCFNLFYKKKVAPIPQPPPPQLVVVQASPWRQFESDYKRTAEHPSYATVVYTEEEINALEERHSIGRPSRKTSSNVSDKEIIVLEDSIKKMVRFSEFVSEAYINSRSS